MLGNRKHRIGAVRRRGPSPAMVVAVIALFVALGSGAYAAVTLPPNSVGAKQLKNAAVTPAKIQNGAVTSSKIQDRAVASSKIQDQAVTHGKIGNGAITSANVHSGSLVPADFPAGTFPGPPVVRSTSTSFFTGMSSMVAQCLPGEYATGGGVSIRGGGSSGAVVSENAPEGPGDTGPPPDGQPATGWRGTAQSSTGPISLLVWVVCIKG
jgi:hypothetical protein